MALALYEANQVRELERRVMASRGLTEVELMRMAAAAAWQQARRRWPHARHILLLCGPGNNGGDGYEIAQLARAGGCEVCCVGFGDSRPGSAAEQARQRWDGPIERWRVELLDRADLVIDALFGIGLNRPLQGEIAEAIEQINRRGAELPVLAVDVPSGLDADTGVALGPTLIAQVTVSFIGRKLGLYVSAGPDAAGERVFAPLGPFDDGSVPCAADLMQADDLRDLLPQRSRGAHKGMHGHVLLIGGSPGMPGALLLAGRAALRCGAGLVSLATHASHAIALSAAQPELMAHAVQLPAELQPLLERSNVVAIGPGLGQSEWAQALRCAAGAAGRPLIEDADALNLLAGQRDHQPKRIITPHPGEAARLLDCSSTDVQANRVSAVRRLQAEYGGVCVLKGAGTLVLGRRLAVCPYGNPGMGTGGMGDALTGSIAALLAQGLALEDAARAGVLAHALAGDVAASNGQRGLLPSDLIASLRTVVNP